MSLSTYITRQRIDYARYLLKNTDRSMADIASECGFFDQSHFTKSFRAVEGSPPLRYRKQVQPRANAASSQPQNAASQRPRGATPR